MEGRRAMILWAVSRPAVIWAVAVMIVLGGGVSFTRLALATMTTVELPRLFVSAAWSGASAELVEMYLASPIEAAVQGVRGVRRTSSQSREGSASLTIELDPNADVQLTRLGDPRADRAAAPEFPAGRDGPVGRELRAPRSSRSRRCCIVLSRSVHPGRDAAHLPRRRAAPQRGARGRRPACRRRHRARRHRELRPRLLRQLGIAPQVLTVAVGGARWCRRWAPSGSAQSKREVVLRDQPGALEELEATCRSRARPAGLPPRGPGAGAPGGGLARAVLPRERQHRARAHRHARGRADAIKTAAAVRAVLAGLGAELPPGIRWRITSDDSVELERQLTDLSGAAPSRSSR
jgi:hypothetical protein